MSRGSPFIAATEVLSIEMMLKATPVQEGGERFIYLEASNEKRDQQNEMVLAKALEASADHYLKFGNIDIDHKSMPSVARMYGIEDPHMWEVGTPVDVRISKGSTFVKAQLMTGDTPLAEKANMVWDSMTRLSPPRKWYPSVGGKVLHKSQTLDKATGDKVNVVDAVQWTNIAISQHPVNQHIGGIKTIPFDVLAKSYGVDGFDLRKALEAGYSTDAASKTGGEAFGMQSLDGGGVAPHTYYDFRERLADSLGSGDLKRQSPEALVAFSVKRFSLSRDEAAEWVDRFMADLKSGLKKP